ncbi:site-specific integrase [Acidithiobacillus sp. MC6.1]|nr:site-specific integrase [Acidithiobacillus sp. MC6.1]
MATISARKGPDENDKMVVIGYQAIIRKKGHPSQTKTFRAKRDAERWARQIESEMERGVFVQRTESEQTTLNELLDRYSREVLPTLKGGYREQSRIKALQNSLGAYSLAVLNSSMIAKYRDKRLSTISEKTGRLVSAQTVKHELGLLQRALKMAVMEWGIALPGGIPTATVKKPSLPPSRNRRLVDDEEERLLAACGEARNAWLRPVVIFAIETAMRAGEIVETWKLNKKTGKREMVSIGLQWSEVDLKKRTAHLPQTKNGDARTVPLSSRAVATLEALPRNLDGRVFGVTYEGIHQSYVRACRRAGVTGLTFHDLRHEGISRLAEQGLTILELQAISGHKTIQMLLKYTHLRAEDLALKLR